MASSHPTLLLKTRSLPHDPYTTLPSPTFVPVLTHSLRTQTLDRLRTLLTAPTSSPSSLPSQYGGLILTSQRAVEALGSVLDGLAASLPASELSRIKTQLSSIKIVVYVVGPATGKATRDLLRGWLPRARVEGDDAGNGEALAAAILRFYRRGRLQSSSEDGPIDADQGQKGDDSTNNHDVNSGGGNNNYDTPRPKLLFLVGEKRRDVIPKTLMDPALPAVERVEVEEMVVYETCERESFADEFATQLQATAREAVRWVVVFSPTGCEAMLRALGWLGEDGKFEERRRGREEGTSNRTFVASIGPTTREFLRKKFVFEVDVCAGTPSPEGVGRGIEEFMANFEQSR